MISIRELIHAYAATLKKTWRHDRSKTVGASEIGQCERKVWFDKNGIPFDADYVPSWGAQVRGDMIEDYFWVPALRSQLPDSVRLLYAVDEQKTLTKGYLSATTDGLLVFEDGTSVNLDCKSIDVRVNLQKEKSEHAFQVQTQMGLFRECTQYKPDSSIISYINSSFYDEVREFVIPFNPRIYQAAQARAEKIMTASNALEMMPEGKMAGGRECKCCPWASHCRDVTAAGVPEQREALSDDAVSALKDLRDLERELAADKDTLATEHAGVVERIKGFLREHDTRGYKGEDWGVFYSVSSGRATLDIQAIEAAGIDLEPYRKVGSPSDRLSVR